MQEINFYPQLKKPSPYRLDAEAASQLLIRVLGFFVIISLLQWAYLGLQSLRVAYSGYQENSIEQSIAGLGKLSSPMNEFITLNTKKTEMEAELKQSPIRGRQFYPEQAFQALASVDNTSEALTEIEFLQQGQVVTLQGVASGYSGLWDFIRALENQKVFAGMHFNLTSQSTDQTSGRINFKLTTK